MRKSLAIAATGALALATLVPAVTATAASDGFSIEHGRLVDANGVDFVPQGVNHAHAWYPDELGSIADIRDAGANAVRVVLSGGRWGQNSASDVQEVIDTCKANELVCILENHDTTGYGEDGSATSLATAAQYWTGLASVLEGEEAYVLINLGNEPYGNTGYSNWGSETVSAIQTLRNAGLEHTIVADAPNWGQDWSATMQSQAASVAAADDNTMFSIHMYGVYDTGAEVRAYLDSFTDRGLPIMVGEFGDYHSDGDPDEATIMSYTRAEGIGMMGWSWSGNGSGVEYLDMVNGFDANSLTAWGQRFINGTDGLATRSAQVASVYSGTTEPTDPDEEPTHTSNGYPYCTNGASSDPDGDGWGWESSASCVVRGSSADPGPAEGGGSEPEPDPTTDPDDGATHASNGYPYCTGGSASDPDGDGWGWEGSGSCVVRDSTADPDASSGGTELETHASNGYPYCTGGSASDPDGDGWGWESSASCVVRGSSADA